MERAVHLIAEAREKRGAGDLDGAILLQKQAIEQLRAGDRSAALAHALRHLAEMAAEVGDCSTATSTIEEAMALYRRLDGVAPLDFANAVRVEAVVAETCGDVSSAMEAWTSARDHYAALDDVFARLGIEGNPGVAEADERLAGLGAD